MRNLFILLILSLGIHLSAQVAINTDGTSPAGSAMLDVKSTTKGLLAPRMTSAQRLAIPSPVAGLLVFDNSTGTYWYYNGSIWNNLTPAVNAVWSITGNTFIDSSLNFIGTIDNKPLRFRINNTWAGELNPSTSNVFLGRNAGQSNTSGNSNVAIGEQSLSANSTGGYNSAIGFNSLGFNTTGNDNTASGAYALYHNTTGIENTAMGRNALFALTTGSSNSATGKDALLATTTGDANTANGYRTMFSNITGGYNVATGYQSLYSNISGINNVGIGSMTLYSNTTGASNTAIGTQSLNNNISGNNNVAVGSSALLFNLGDNNTAVGFAASPHNQTGTNNTSIGYQSFFDNLHGSNNLAAGYRALSDNTEGSFNTAVGNEAMKSNQSGTDNVAVGQNALYGNVTGSYNIAIGRYSGTHPGTPAIFNTISIGNDGYLNAYQNQVFIGNLNTQYIGGKVTWSTFSDARIKSNVKEDVKGLDFITRLRPVTYLIDNKAITLITGNTETPDYSGKSENESVRYTGFIAQDVEQAAKDSGYEFSGYSAPKNQWGLYTLSYEQFVVPLVKAVQELNAANLSQQQFIEQQKIELAELKSRLEKLENR
ncbi:MAG: tail fiber domain-containing protein [Bacteroidales bacterium]|nr:tail fiber domain-containing protein [Bacteroidales bacterium]